MSDDVTSQEAVVAKPPYRMVPGNDRVCTGDVLSRFANALTPSKSQRRRKVDWVRDTVDVHNIVGLLVRRSGIERVNSSSGNPGFHTTMVAKIREVHVRWYGNPEDEPRHLEHLAQILRSEGYTVYQAAENNVDWPFGHSRSFILARRNRKFLRVARFKAIQRKQKR